MIRIIVVTLLLSGIFPVRAGLLEDYINKENEALAYKIEKETNTLGLRILSIRLTSQKWRGKEWKHWLTVFIPPVVDAHKKGILLIEGGSNRDGLPNPSSEAGLMLGMTALNLRVPMALLLQVPSQPLYDNLYEDDLIAHTFDKYLKGGDNEWPLLLPMVKSATAAMDALQGLVREGHFKTGAGVACALEKFIVAGASKRGWTTWLTAAVDHRVCALAPSVIDVLNMDDQMRLQKKSYGMLSTKIKPYTSRNIMERLESPRGELLLKVVDPFEYLEKLQHPKLLLLGTNDPYWTADSAQLYYPQLQGPKAIYYLPNAGHGLGLGVLPTLNGFFVSVLENKPFPQLRTENGGGKFKVSWEGKGKAELWSAEAAGRDFRSAKWSATALEGAEQVSIEPKTPTHGWQASFVTVTFPGLRKGDAEFKLSTPIQVLPEKFPNE